MGRIVRFGFRGSDSSFPTKTMRQEVVDPLSILLIVSLSLFMAPFQRQFAFSATSLWSTVRHSHSIRSAVRAATEILKHHEIPEAAASAEFLAVSSFGIVRTRKDARTLLERPPDVELNRYVSLCRERHTCRKPIQYLVGDWDFHNITLLVRPPVLIPRPETEELVEHLLNDVKADNARILDVGCGSGAILLAALVARPNWRGVGIDTSSDAVALTLENAQLHSVMERIEIYPGNITQVVGGRRYDVIASNPPYIPVKDMDGLEPEVRQHEDYRALCGGEDGLDVVREILKFAPAVLKPGGSLWLELDHTHPEKLEQMRFDGLEFVTRLDDMYGRPRFCHLRAS